MIQRRVLVLLAHPSPERSAIGSRLRRIASRHDAVTLVDLYAEYPDYRIDIDAEQRRLCEHDVIMFLFPVYWYSTPAILKEWQDLVLEYGFAYGSEGRALAGKYFIAACSAGGPAEAYTAEGYNRHTLRELLRPLERTATLCRMRYLPPLVLFDARRAADDGRAIAHGELFRDLLGQLATAPIEAWSSSDAEDVNGLVRAGFATAEGRT